MEMGRDGLLVICDQLLNNSLKSNICLLCNFWKMIEKYKEQIPCYIYNYIKIKQS